MSTYIEERPRTDDRGVVAPVRLPNSDPLAWRWGFREKTGLDLLQIFAGLAASLFIPLAVQMLSVQQAKTAEDAQRQELVSKYYDQMSALLLDKGLATLPNRTSATSILQHSRVVSMARARTLSIFRQLDGDGERRGQLLKFLYESKLIGGQCKDDPTTLTPAACQPSLLPLDGAKLEGLTFDSSIRLTGVNLYRVSLAGAKMPNIDLSRAEMKQANLKQANLSQALLKNVQMEKAILEGVDLSGAWLTNAHLKNANLRNANLSGANLARADLSGANLAGADLRGADLTGTNLTGANLKKAIYVRKSADQTETKFPAKFDPAQQGMRPG